MQKMWLLTGKNHYDARLGKMEANRLADQITECLKRDRELMEEFHTIDNGKWYGMGLSEHIGFTRWNEDECQNPILMHVLPANKPRLVVSVDGTDQHSEGSAWHKNKLYLNDFLQPDVEEASFTISSISDINTDFKITCKNQWL
ncbi:MAG: alpha-glucuronidase, partial [Bacillus sp. (in: firmicutes)]